MAFTDDVDGSPAEKTKIFCHNEQWYEVDLNAAHAAELDAALDTVRRYAGHGRLTGGTAAPERAQPDAPALLPHDGADAEAVQLAADVARKLGTPWRGTEAQFRKLLGTDRGPLQYRDALSLAGTSVAEFAPTCLTADLRTYLVASAGDDVKYPHPVSSPDGMFQTVMRQRVPAEGVRMRSSQLLALLTSGTNVPERDHVQFPKSPRMLTALLTEQKEQLAAAGWSVDRDRDYWKLTPPAVSDQADPGAKAEPEEVTVVLPVTVFAGDTGDLELLPVRGNTVVLDASGSKDVAAAYIESALGYLLEEKLGCADLVVLKSWKDSWLGTARDAVRRLNAFDLVDVERSDGSRTGLTVQPPADSVIIGLPEHATRRGDASSLLAGADAVTPLHGMSIIADGADSKSWSPTFISQFVYEIFDKYQVKRLVIRNTGSQSTNRGIREVARQLGVADRVVVEERPDGSPRGRAGGYSDAERRIFMGKAAAWLRENGHIDREYKGRIGEDLLRLYRDAQEAKQERDDERLKSSVVDAVSRTAVSAQ